MAHSRDGSVHYMLYPVEWLILGSVLYFLDPVVWLILELVVSSTAGPSSMAHLEVVVSCTCCTQ